VNQSFTDDMWPHFAPLWMDLRAIAPGLLLAGGYALFLKQQWLIAKANDITRTLVAIEHWIDAIPRVTNDLDFVVELDLIASQEDQRLLSEALEKHQFCVVPKNSRWQFAKQVNDAHQIVVDFHAAPPLMERDDVRVQSRRVKPNPSLAQRGIHGRENAEAIGCKYHPFIFEFANVEVAIPNPVTLAFMKLVATRDKRLAAQNADKSADVRNEFDAKAKKHARDVYRVIAMMTRDESDAADEIVKSLRDTNVFAAASETFTNLFATEHAWAKQVAADILRPADLQQIQNKLADWFR
jgi:hypothetical protein